ncbi:nucleoside diphosphate kinase [Marinitoga sp. 1135]|uniref:Nucleoside diphosphate kinase n=1 Tax=Marinitoga piezophila (strain DSM 14283 / JCM 11233 / KA3) TaxID=443254 RepID=H2J588_MARPK|nr:MULTISPECIES: nucleoside-diphosphate kinase [Marinitoga]AEX84946.1 nucleoside diphosphate kinase [Marinitoga piezophila KA3]APT75453.1 nucleoside diphosphate kinase [Marinitoga sp. 1137]NUU95178.1 nucleoside diphosphate kinase [Marinitoga sp. 1135]NUU97110.1 nucleoside diphosphate kinase [Marinitoga sp. 1138]
MVEREFIFLKPNTIRRGLTGEVISRLERRGIKIIALKMIQFTREQAEKLYEEHKDKPFYNELIDFVLSGPSVVMVVEGPRVIEMVRHIIGATDPLKASPGSIRGEFGMSVTKNIVHASDSPEKAEREMKIFFSEEEILNYRLDVQGDL